MFWPNHLLGWFSSFDLFQLVSTKVFCTRSDVSVLATNQWVWVEFFIHCYTRNSLFIVNSVIQVGFLIVTTLNIIISSLQKVILFESVMHKYNCRMYFYYASCEIMYYTRNFMWNSNESALNTHGKCKRWSKHSNQQAYQLLHKVSIKEFFF